MIDVTSMIDNIAADIEIREAHAAETAEENAIWDRETNHILLFVGALGCVSAMFVTLRKANWTNETWIITGLVLLATLMYVAIRVLLAYWATAQSRTRWRTHNANRTRERMWALLHEARGAQQACVDEVVALREMLTEHGVGVTERCERVQRDTAVRQAMRKLQKM